MASTWVGGVVREGEMGGVLLDSWIEKGDSEVGGAGKRNKKGVVWENGDTNHCVWLWNMIINCWGFKKWCVYEIIAT